MRNWKPIETAPTGGETILVTGYHEGETPEYTGWLTQIVQAFEHEFDGGDWGHTRNLTPFTHWMPIPEPPEDA